MSFAMHPPPRIDQHTPLAMGNNGMIASAQPLAALAGLQVLVEGGNAFDAAIAAALVEDVTLPAMTSLGGDLFAVVYHQQDRSVYAINGSGCAPSQASIDWFKQSGFKQLPPEGLLSCSVPGEVHGLMTMHKRFGSMPIERLIRPALDFAENGFPVNERLHWRIQRVKDKLIKYPETRDVFLTNGEAPKVGSRLYQRNLANTLRKLMTNGLNDFYQGEIAEQIVKHMSHAGGLISGQDLKAHQTDVCEPISTNYRGYTIYGTTPPSQGLIVLEALNILEGYDIAGMGYQSAEWIHHMVEAKKLAYSDRIKYCGDPRFIHFDMETLLSKAYASELRKSIGSDKVLEHHNGLIERIDGDTTYLAVADKYGNCVSLIHSLSGVEFGSGLTLGDTGIVLNSRLGRGFAFDKNHPNALQPGKRTMHTLNAYMVFDGQHPKYIGGTPGGDQQPQWNIQTIVNLIDFKLNVQQAAECPRWFSYPGTDPASLVDPFELRLEDRFNQEVYSQLADKGHRVKLINPWAGGGVQLIELNKEAGCYFGGSDPRIGGLALAY